MNRLLSWRGHPFLALPARLYLAAIFLIACWHKLLDPQAFALDIATYQILPTSLVNLMAIVLPWLELVTAAMLLSGLRVRAASLLIAGMMAMFLIAILIALGRGLEMSCGCFASQGAAEDPISWKTVVRDGVWLLLALYVLVFDSRPLGIERLVSAVRRRAAQE
ncbi:MAG: DoxX family membrane protein [Deltaproteobacteria bacterium]|nr:DoxX family membrane protein [Deltaproteobacteria bacterium]